MEQNEIITPEIIEENINILTDEQVTTVNVDPIQEIETILEKEEKIQQKSKRFRLNNKHVSKYSTEERILRSKRENKNVDDLYNHLYNILDNNFNLIAVRWNNEYLNNYYQIVYSHHIHQKLAVSDSLIVDSNLNQIISINSELDLRDRSSLISKNFLYDKILQPFSELVDKKELSSDNYVIFDYEKFIQSKGKIFQIKEKSKDTSYKKILDVKKSFLSVLKNCSKTIDELKNYLSFVYNEDDFDITILSNITNPQKLQWLIAIKFSDIVIKNSLEDEKNIGNIITYLGGYKCPDRYTIKPILYGIKQKYSVSDALNSYVHSHLHPLASSSISSFCLGSSDLFASRNIIDDSIDEIGLISVFLALEDYIKWESLEGGPYLKMEQNTILKTKDDIITKVSPISGHFVTSKFRIDLINLIKENYEDFKSIFKLVKDEKGYTFTYNDYDLYECIGNLIKNNHGYLSISTYLYNINNHKFYYNNGNLGEWDSIVDLARKKIKSYDLPPYFKGKLIPVELDTEIGKEEIKSNTYLPIPHPGELTMIVNAFIELLNQTLKKDEYKNRI